MTTCKKLIEVSMPVKQISAESVRDKSIRHALSNVEVNLPGPKKKSENARKNLK
jgi:adenine-specific DNA methylase